MSQPNKFFLSSERRKVGRTGATSSKRGTQQQSQSSSSIVKVNKFTNSSGGANKYTDALTKEFIDTAHKLSKKNLFGGDLSSK
mmetsp:Transcript_13550/g.21146  ORF Transcript_13550/g.21146 Transcript_13550/m.21146 type:complete len:83 (-) Transcript_13550:1103-1351(-)|eukprot:CAMPEP_0170488510 /NCGR_PEP_ID=MMETSP0208-20121228/7059_1 /TAXON_ID=197538 /ORGANISM="Strombidium inclinatum, Strain S3" /LENGTH=82 /DNA_ID=CAMNT_0010763115 /DNA_START=635 /DNA_END=883 /DNA_ORIENTATION=-